MPGEPPATAGSKSSKAKRISIPRVQSSTDTELQSQQSQSCSTPLQPTGLHYVTFRSELEDSPIPPALRCRLYDLFQQIEKEFEMLYTENLGLQEKIDILNDRLERECYGSGERSLPPGDLTDYPETKNLSKQKSMGANSAQKIKASHKLKAQTSKIVSSFKTPSMTCTMQKEYVGHRDGVWEVSIGRSGQPIIATASADYTARIWAIDNSRCLLQYIGHNGSVNSVRFHPNRELALSASGDCSAHVWQAAVDWDMPKRVPSLEELPVASSERSTVNNLISNDEQDDPPTLRTPIRELLGHTNVVMAADWLSGAEQLVTASWDRTANLYDTETGEIIHTLCGHDQELTHVSTHHTQKLCVTSSRDNTFRLWDFREPIHSVSVFQGHTETVTSAVFTREDKIVSGSDDRSVKVWELRNIRSPLATIRGDSAANRLSVSSTGIVAIPHDNRQIRLFDLSGQRLARLPRTSRQASGEELEAALNVALEAGYRHIDTATVYENERIIGNVLKKWLDSDKIKRSDLFIVTKVPPGGNRPGDIEKWLKRSLSNLQLSYLDLYLVHTPFAYEDVEGELHPFNEKGEIRIDINTDHLQIWSVMEKQVLEGRTKAIGLSNFNIDQMKRILDNAKLPVSNLQIELHVYFQQKDLVKFCQDNNISVTAYAPLGSRGFVEKVGKEHIVPDLLQNLTVLEVADKYEKTPAQILLKHIIQKGIATIPKSTNPLRIQENIELFDWELEAEDVDKLNALDMGESARICDFSFFKGLSKHPEFPF